MSVKWLALEVGGGVDAVKPEGERAALGSPEGSGKRRRPSALERKSLATRMAAASHCFSA